jgi:hypothetical protein
MSESKSIEQILSISDKDIYSGFTSQNFMKTELTNSSISWASLVEEEITTDVSDKCLGSENEKSGTDIFDGILSDIASILKLKVTELSDSDILKYQTFISSELKKKIKEHTENKTDISSDFFLENIKWIFEGTALLSEKLGLENIKFNPKNGLQRSSYKFCEHGCYCEYNYNLKKHKWCFSKHYVYNILKADLESLIWYLEKTDDEISISELRKSSHTISFVINHMYEELRQIESLKNDTTGKYHIERTPTGKVSKKRYRKGNAKY